MFFPLLAGLADGRGLCPLPVPLPVRRDVWGAVTTEPVKWLPSGK